jgi:hypothetical protein
MDLVNVKLTVRKMVDGGEKTWWCLGKGMVIWVLSWLECHGRGKGDRLMILNYRLGP